MRRILALLAVCAAQAQDSLPIAGYPAARDVPNAGMLPDPTRELKVVFDAAAAAENVDDVNPMLVAVARYVNTLAKWGVPNEKRHIIVMFHQRSDDFDIVLNNAAFKAKYGKDNPNIALIKALGKAGVEFRACGQAVAGREIDPADVNSDIQIDLWAMTSFMNLQMKGFVRTGN